MQLVLCHSFSKQLKKLGSIRIDDLKQTLRKHPDTNNIVGLDEFGGFEVLKCYLLQKKVRAVVLLRGSRGTFIPVAIVRKESPKGKNITKDNFMQLFGGDLERTFKELEEQRYQVENIDS